MLRIYLQTQVWDAAEKEEKIRKAKEAMSKKEGSLASKANMVSEFNKRNEK